MDNGHIKYQENNREKAYKHISDWLDCFIEADAQYKNLLGRDFIELLTIKAQGNQELNYWLNQAINVADILRMIFG